MIPKGWSRLGLAMSLALLGACTPSSSDKTVEQEPKGPVNPPLVSLEESCSDGKVFWPDSDLAPLGTQLRSRLPADNEYWLGTIDSTVVCQILRPSCSAAEDLSAYFSLLCPEGTASEFLDRSTASAQKLRQICEQEKKKFHDCQTVLSERLLESFFVPVTDRPRFYQLKPE